MRSGKAMLDESLMQVCCRTEDMSFRLANKLVRGFLARRSVRTLQQARLRLYFLVRVIVEKEFHRCVF